MGRAGAWGVLFGRGTGHDLANDGFEREAHVLDGLGIPWEVVELEAVLHDGAEDAVRHLSRRPHGWLYRGWMLRLEDYEELYEAVLGRGQYLVVNPSAYAAAAYVPEWVEVLGSATPQTIWTEDVDPDEAWELAMEELGPPPWLIKDWLKSARQLWNHACFVAEGTSQDRFAEMVQALVDFHEDRLTGGIVVRQFVDLVRLPYVAQGHPVFDEHRIVFWKGRPIGHAPYHDVEVEPLDRVPFAEIGQWVDSPFFTADVGRLKRGGFTVIELNDGGCSTLPGQLDPWLMYEAMLADPP